MGTNKFQMLEWKQTGKESPERLCKNQSSPKILNKEWSIHNLENKKQYRRQNYIGKLMHNKNIIICMWDFFFFYKSNFNFCLNSDKLFYVEVKSTLVMSYIYTEQVYT